MLAKGIFLSVLTTYFTGHKFSMRNIYVTSLLCKTKSIVFYIKSIYMFIYIIYYLKIKNNI
jgi:hypothetical protein